jgi:hypothetical protein
MRVVVIGLLLAGVALGNSQTPAPEQPQPEPKLSPQAAYDQVIRPLEITRRSPQNWSEIELGSLKIARELAKQACADRNPDQLTGDDLLALARLCAFAQLWQPVYQAASNYIAAAQGSTPGYIAAEQANSMSSPSPVSLANSPSQPADSSKSMVSLAIAFDYKVQASLGLDKPDDAVMTAQTMLRTVPYDEFSSEATNSTLHYIHYILVPDAVALLTQRQPILIGLIKSYGVNADAIKPDESGAGTPSTTTVSAPSLRPPLPLHTLYADAIALPVMQQLANKSEDAARSYAELEAALPSGVSSEDGLLLGTHLPTLNPMGSLLSSDAPAPTNLNTRFAYANVFLLFPDWCNQCIAMVFNSAARPKELLEVRHVLFFPLMAQANPPEKRAKESIKNVPLPPARSGKGAQSQTGQQERLHVDQQLAIKSTPDARLEDTPTVIVPMETLDAFAAVDFPLIIATDHNGIVRVLQVASDDALGPGGEIDQIVMHILATWPPD